MQSEILFASSYVEFVATGGRADRDRVGIPYQVRVSSIIEFLRIGSLISLAQSQFVTASRTTSPLSHNPGQAVRPLSTNAGLLGSMYRGSRPVTRSVRRDTTTRVPTTIRLTFNARIILILSMVYKKNKQYLRSGELSSCTSVDRVINVG